MQEVKELGLRYNENKPKWSLVHYESLVPMIRVLEYGAHKYSIFKDPTTNELIKGSEVTPEQVKARGLLVEKTGKENWKNPLNLTEILESMQRHLAELMDGSQHDAESVLHHMGHIQCNAMFYNYHRNREIQELENLTL